MLLGWLRGIWACEPSEVLRGKGESEGMRRMDWGEWS
jgi:hypothetical protein